MASTDVSKRKQARKEELRAYLSNRGKLDYVLDNIEKIESLAVESESFQKDLLKLKTANEQRIRLLAKYLPDMKDDSDEPDSSQPITINLIKPTDE
jgi:hypothetical protein